MANKFPDHSVPGSVNFLGAVLSILDWSNYVVEAHKLGDLLGQINAKTFVLYHFFAVLVNPLFLEKVRLALTQKNKQQGKVI